MKAKSFLTLLILLAPLTYGSELKSIKWQTYQDTDLGFEMPYSSDWKLKITQPPQPNTILKELWFTIPGESDQNGMLVISKQSGSLEQHLKMATLASKDGDPEVIKMRFKTKEAYKIIQKKRPGTMGYMLQDGAYVMDITTIAGKNESYFKPIFDHVLAGFRFTNEQ